MSKPPAPICSSPCWPESSVQIHSYLLDRQIWYLTEKCRKIMFLWTKTITHSIPLHFALNLQSLSWMQWGLNEFRFWKAQSASKQWSYVLIQIMNMAQCQWFTSVYMVQNDVVVGVPCSGKCLVMLWIVVAIFVTLIRTGINAGLRGWLDEGMGERFIESWRLIKSFGPLVIPRRNGAILLEVGCNRNRDPNGFGRQRINGRPWDSFLTSLDATQVCQRYVTQKKNGWRLLYFIV